MRNHARKQSLKSVDFDLEGCAFPYQMPPLVIFSRFHLIRNLTNITQQDILVRKSEISLKKVVLRTFFSISSNSFKTFLNDVGSVWGCLLGLKACNSRYQTIYKRFLKISQKVKIRLEKRIFASQAAFCLPKRVFRAC